MQLHYCSSQHRLLVWRYLPALVTVCVPNPRFQTTHEHPRSRVFASGNWLFRTSVIANQEYYRGLHHDLKERAADALLGEFEKLGARFLGVSDQMRFYELGYDRAIEKIKQALWEKG